MGIKIEIPQYNVKEGITCKWENGFEVKTTLEDTSINIKANKEGLISLANHFLHLAQDDVPSGSHLHFDEYNSLEEGSCELIIQKV